MLSNNTVKVEVEVGKQKIIGFVEERNLFEFNNGLDSSLRVRMIHGQSKGTDFYKSQVDQVKRV